MCFHPTKPLIAVGEFSGRVTGYHLVEGSKAFEIFSGADTLLSIGFYLGFLFTFSEHGILKKWDLSTGACLSTLRIDVQNPEKIDNIEQPATPLFIPNTPFLIVDMGEWHGLIQYHILTGEQCGCYPVGHGSEGLRIVYLASSNDCSSLYAIKFSYYGSWGPWRYGLSICRWNTMDFELLSQSDEQSDCSDFHALACLAPMSNGKVLLSYNEDIYNKRVGEISQISMEGADTDCDEEEGDWSFRFNSGMLAAFPTQNMFVCGGDTGGEITFFDLNTRKVVFEEVLFNTPIEELKFTPDGHYLGAFSRDHSLVIYSF